MVAVTQYTFTITSMAFLTSSMRDVVGKWVYGDDTHGIYRFGDLRNIWTYGVFVITVLTLLAWVRNIAMFSFTFLFANVLMLSSALFIIIYSI